ncbi:rhodanese-like domain-containing protein [Pengzhenrongella phosphoraccumulans]|jgi:rhodanese-related sulfurtransferase|uniref:rhodanese-like domain-containing protein n=1 Tax=Pengzhenrongella phosphoraccumulans TaxID=3114394 RepID=UPI00388DC9EE
MSLSALPTVNVSELDPTAPIPPGTTLVDVREQNEWDAGHAPGAVHLPLGELIARVGELPAGRLLIMCHLGGRSARATAWLNGAGFDAVNLDGGMVDWTRAGLPVV